VRLAGRNGLLIVTLLFLVFTSFRSLRSEQAKRSTENIQLFIETTLTARQLYLLQNLPAGSFSPPQLDFGLAKERQKLFRNLDKLTRLEADPAILRRLALLQYALGEGNWKLTLLRLRTLPTVKSPFEVERELTLWRQVLQDQHIPPGRIPALRQRIERMELGWYRHIALEALYERAGMLEAARREHAASLRSSLVLFILVPVLLMVVIAGFTLGAMLILLYWRKYKHPEFSLPKALVPVRLPEFTRPQSDALYTVFLVYLLTFVILRVVAGSLLQPLLRKATSMPSAEWLLLLSLSLMLISLVIPLGLLAWWNRRVGLCFRHIGWGTHHLGWDMAWGVAGYVMAIPLVLISTLISAWLFRRVESPLHPVILEFMRSPSLLAQVLLFIQAAILAPIAEETMFRGVFFNALTPRTGRAGALLLTSTVFAILHPQLPLGFLGIFTLGVVFNTLYLLRGSLLPCMIAHGLNNGVIFLFFAVLVGG